MSFLLDTNVVSAHVRRPTLLAHRLLQHAGRLFVPAIVEAELCVWAYQRDDPTRLLAPIREFLKDCQMIPFDSACADRFGRTRVEMNRSGLGIADVDLMIASVALVHGLVLVTHNLAHSLPVPGLVVEDWLGP